MVDPSDYGRILEDLAANGGQTSLALRFSLAQKAFAHTADYDRAIADYLGARRFAEASAGYQFQDG